MEKFIEKYKSYSSKVLQKLAKVKTGDELDAIESILASRGASQEHPAEEGAVYNATETEEYKAENGIKENDEVAEEKPKKARKAKTPKEPGEPRPLKRRYRQRRPKPISRRPKPTSVASASSSARRPRNRPTASSSELVSTPATTSSSTASRPTTVTSGARASTRRTWSSARWHRFPRRSRSEAGRRLTRQLPKQNRTSRRTHRLRSKSELLTKWSRHSPWHPGVVQEGSSPSPGSNLYTKNHE